MKQFFEGLSEKAKAKLQRDFEKAKADPAAQMLVDNLNRNVRREAQAQKPEPKQATHSPS